MNREVAEELVGPAAKIFAAALLVTIFWLVLVAFWWFLDHRFPYWDAAAHVKDSIHYAQLISHLHIFKKTWWHEFLTVSFNYPMTPHLFAGLLKTLLGWGRLSDCVGAMIYLLILCCSIYRLTYLLTRDALAAAFAILFIYCFPIVAMLSHVQMLDFGCLSLVTLALAGLVNWSQKQTISSAWSASLCLALGATSKQAALLFLLAPCLVLTVGACLKKPALWRQVLVLALLPAIFLTIWFIPNAAALKDWRDYYYPQTGASAGFFNTFGEHLGTYLACVVPMVSPLLFVCFCLALVYLFVGKFALRTLYLPLLAGSVGILSFSCLAMNNPEDRYIVPALLYPALVCACAASRLVSRGGVARALAVGLAFLAVLQNLLLTFTPYPLALPAPLGAMVAAQADAYKQGGQVIGLSPVPDGDIWGQQWVVDAVTKNSQGPVRLNVMPSTPEISVHCLDLVRLLAHKEMDISTFRQFTLKGDLVRFSTEAVAYYNWYLLKTGNQGSPLADRKSEENYAAIEAVVEKSGKFELVCSRPVADGGTLKLYRQK